MLLQTVTEDELNIFSSPARLVFIGNSGSGKTSLFIKIAQKYARCFDQIVIIGGNTTTIPGVKNLKIDPDFNPLNEDVDEKTLYLFDDTLYQNNLVKLAAQCFTRLRHKNSSIAFCSQSLYFNSQDFRIILNNTTHLFLLKLRCLRQVSFFAKSFLSKEEIEKFLEIYKKVVLKEKYSYILIDYTVDYDSPLQIRSNVADERIETCYKI